MKSRRFIQKKARVCPPVGAEAGGRISHWFSTVYDFQPRRRVESLVIGRVEFHLVHIHPIERTLRMGWRSNTALLRKCGCCNHGRSATESCAPRDDNCNPHRDAA